MKSECGLVDYIGLPALFEQTAEECNELAFACLKWARYLRGDNKVYGRTEQELISAIEEEVADIAVCIDELLLDGHVDGNHVIEWRNKKLKRRKERLKEEGFI